MRITTMQFMSHYGELRWTGSFDVAGLNTSGSKLSRATLNHLYLEFTPPDGKQKTG